MPEMNLSSAMTTEMKSNVPAYSVAPMNSDSATGAEETEYLNAKASQYLGYYRKIPELHSAITSFATWIVGQGYETEDEETRVIIEHITGWGEDTFNSIIWNAIIQKKIYGDCFIEIIRDKETGNLINLKPLDPAKIKIIVDKKGIIKRYEQIGGIGKDVIETFQPNEILHLCNDRICDTIHGISIIEACENVILMKNEIMDDWKTVLHRNVVPVRIIEVNTDNEDEIKEIRKKYEIAIKNKEVIIVPKGSVSITSEAGIGNAVLNPLPFMNYLDDFFYRALGVPKVILGGGQDFTEAASKISLTSYSQYWKREQNEFAADIWNQLGIKIKLKESVNIQNDLLSDESKDANSMALTKPGEMSGMGAFNQ